MAITIKDLAKKAGVSHTTVSRALNDSPLIKKSTIQRIKAIAIEEGYIPNYTAKSLKMNKSFTYGLFFSTLNDVSTNSFVYETIKGVRNQLPKGYRLTVEGIDEIWDMDMINPQAYDGMIIVSQRYMDDQFIELIQEKNIPLVVLNRSLDRKDVPSIAFDDEKGMYMAANQLIQMNHTSIAYISGKEGFCNTDRRYEGYKKALTDKGIERNESLIVDGDFTMVGGYEACKMLLKNHSFTAVICANDETAIGAMKAISEYDLTVGKDISLVGFDNIETCSYLNPPLTSVDRSIESMAYMGIEVLNRLVSEQAVSVQEVSRRQEEVGIILSTELIIRASVTEKE